MPRGGALQRVNARVNGMRAVTGEKHEMDRDAQRASGGAREYASARAALLSPRYDVVPRPPPGNGADMPRRDSNSSGGSVLPALTPAVHHPPPPGRAASPNAFKRTGWTTPRSPPAGEEPLFPGIDGPPRQRSRSLLDDASTGSFESDPDWNAFQPAKPAPRRSEAASGPDRLHALSPTETALPQDMERNQLAYMEQMYNTINILTAELEKERQDRARLEDQATINRLVTESEYASMDAMSALTPTLTELDDAVYGFSPMIRSPVASTVSSRNFRPSPPLPHQPKRPIGTGASAPSTQLPKDQVELCAALGKNAELRIRTREMERTAEKSSQELEQAQKQMKLAERRISNREEKLRGLLKEKMHWQKELKDMRDQVVEEKMRQVDIFRRMETLKREHTAQLEEMESTLRDANAENEELRAHVAELRAQQAYQARRVEELARQAKEEKDNFTACIAETRQRFKEWKENEANTLRVAKEQALSNLKTEYDLKVARHQKEKQKLRDKVKDLEVSLKLMQKDRTLSPLELSLRKAAILGSRDNGGTSEAELIESHARIRELETLLEHSQEYQKRQDSIIKVSEATISRLVQEREVTALDNLSAHPLTLSPASVGGDDLASSAPMAIAGSPLAPRSPRDIRKPSQYSNAKTGIYEKTKSISPPRPSRSYPPSMVAVPDSVDSVSGLVSPQERKSVRPEPLRVSALDAVAPITPVMAPKPIVPAAAPAQVIPPPNEVPSAKEQYLVNELARLRDELEQVKMRQMQSTVATPQTAECIDARVVPNDSNEGGESRANTGAAVSSETDLNHESISIDSASAAATTEPRNGDAAGTETKEMVDASAPHDVEASATTAEDSETKPSALASTVAVESEKPHYASTANSTDKRDPEDAAPASFSESVPVADEVNGCDLGDMRAEDTDEANTSVKAPQTGEVAGLAQLPDTAAEDKAVGSEGGATEDEAVALESAGGAADAVQGSADHGDTASPAGSEDSYVVVESLSSEQVEGYIGVEASVDNTSRPEPAIPVDIETVTCAAEDVGADLEQPAEIDTSGESADVEVGVATSILHSDATTVADSADMIHTKEPDVIALVPVGMVESETSEGADAAGATTTNGNIDDKAQADDRVDLVHSESLGDGEAASGDLVSVGDTTEQTLDAAQPLGNEKPTESDVAQASAAGSTSDIADTGEVEQPSRPVVQPEESKYAAEPAEITLPSPVMASPSISTEAPAALTAIENAESVDVTATGVEDPSATVSTDSALVAENTDTVATIGAMETVESELEAASESDTLAEGDPSTAATTGLEEAGTLKATEENESAEATELDVLGKDTVSDCPLAEETKRADAATETGSSFESPSSATVAFADERLKVEMMAAITAIVDQCGAHESVSFLENDAQSLDRIHAAEAATFSSDGNLSCSASTSGVDEVPVVNEVTDLIATGEDSGNWDTAEASDYVEPPPDAQTASGPEEPEMATEAAVHDEPTSHTEVAHLVVASDNTGDSDAVSLPHVASRSQLSEVNHSAALRVIDPVDERSSPSPAHEMQSMRAAMETTGTTGVSLPSIEMGAVKIADNAETMLEMAETPLVVKAENDSTTSATMLSDAILFSSDQSPVNNGLVAIASATTVTQDGRPEDEDHSPGDPTSELRCFAEAFCRAVLTSAVGELSTRQFPSTDASLQAHAAACNHTESYIFANEESVVKSMKATASDSHSSDDERTQSTASVIVEDTHQEFDRYGVDGVGDDDSEMRTSSPVGDSGTPSCPSERDHCVECRAAASTFVSQTIEAVLQHCPARDSAQTEEVQSLELAVDTMTVPDTSREATAAYDVVDQIKVIESAVVIGVASREAESEVESIISGIVDDTSASNEQHMSDPQLPEERGISEESDDACAEPGNGTRAASDRDAADAASSVSSDTIETSVNTTDKENCVDQLTGASNAALRQQDQSIRPVDETTVEARAGAETSECAEQHPLTAAIAEEMVDGVMRRVVLTFVQNNLHNGAEEATHHTTNDAGSSDDSLGGGDDVADFEQAPDTTDDPLHIEADAALDNVEGGLDTYATSTAGKFEESITPIEPPALSLAAKTQELPVSIEAVAQELAVSAVARAVASAVVSVEIQLNMEHHDAEDNEIRDDFGDHDGRLPVDITTPMHDIDAPSESVVSETAVAAPGICQGPGDPNVDPEVADLLGIVSSAIAAQIEELEEREPWIGAECERREPTYPRDAASASVSADKAAPSGIERATPEVTTHSDTRSLHDCLALAADDQVCQALQTVVAAVSDTAAPGEYSDLADDMAAATPHRSAKEATTEFLASRDQSSSHIAVEDAVNDTIASLLVQLESPLTQLVDTTTALQSSSEPLDAESAYDVSCQSPPAQTTDEIDPSTSPRTSDPTISLGSARDSEVQAVLSDICAQLEQSSTVDQRGSSNTRNARPLAHRRSSQSVLPTVLERPAPTTNAYTASSSDEAAPTLVVEDRRASTRRRTKRNGSILTAEQLLSWDIFPSVVDAAESTVKRYANKRRTSRRGLSEPSRIVDHSSGQNPHLLAYDMRNEHGEQPFSLLDDEMLRIDPNPRRMPQDDEAEQASEIIAKRKKMHYEAYCKSMTQRTTPAFNYAPVYIKFEWSDFVVASPVSPSSRPSPVQKLRLLLKKGVRLPCGQYVIVSAFVRPLEDGNENLRVQIYDSERVEEFIFDFLDDHIKKYVAGWGGKDDQAREFVAQLEFRREQGAVIIKLPEKKGLLDAHGRRCQSDNGLGARCDDGESRVGSTIKMEQPEGDYKSEVRAPKAPSRCQMFSTQRPVTSPELQPLGTKQEQQQTGKDDSDDDERDRRPALSAVSDATESSAE